MEGIGGKTMNYCHHPSPIGPLLLMGTDEDLTGITMQDHKRGPSVAGDWIETADLPVFVETKRQLDEYFAGSRRVFDVPLAPVGTEFQQAVWRLLLAIPFGETRSYGDLAKQLGRPGASRAVGHSNARNPISIIVPCHRVIGSSGTLTGYAGGLSRKETLLRHERSVAGVNHSLFD